MISVQEYRTFVKEKVIPNGLLALDLCTSHDETLKWRAQLIADLCSKPLQIESDTHDESSLPERDHLRAKKASFMEWQ